MQMSTKLVKSDPKLKNLLFPWQIIFNEETQALTYHGLEGDVAVLLEGRLTLLLGGGLVVGDVGQVAFLLVAVVAFDPLVVHNFFNLEFKSVKCKKRNKELSKSIKQSRIIKIFLWEIKSEIRRYNFNMCQNIEPPSLSSKFNVFCLESIVLTMTFPVVVIIIYNKQNEFAVHTLYFKSKRAWT